MGNEYILTDALDAHAAGSKLSSHPTDKLIRELLRFGRPATVEEIGQIERRMATAPFPTAVAHRDRHVTDEQWTEATTVQQYTDDVRKALSDPKARLAVYVRRGGHMAAAITDTARIVPNGRRGARSVPLLFVAHSADRGILVAGYQASSLKTVALPEQIRWLR